MATQTSAQSNPLAAVVAGLAATGGAVDLEQLRRTVDTMVPFCNHVGVRVTELAPDHGQAELPVRPELQNHFGTVHAGALFLAAEVAGAAAFAGAMAPRITQLQGFVLRSSRIAFLKPANGRVRARATLEQKAIDAVLMGSHAGRFELAGLALLHDDADVLLGRVELDYVAWMGAASS
ncbi:YiiD C-terminal domain-containing protein [Pseudonocardia sp. RS010]|uniref:YiiD C-terminal domain-containing protein n=1 Tax=Pseudonocardia sp. RS010 TaxID=3385979 RepID=UPI00399F278D